MIENICALEKIKKLKDNSQDIIFADPPYALGSTVGINEEGKPYYINAKDFMGKWDMPDEKFWGEFFVEANRVLKFGGRVIFFGIDRQLMLFQYYGIASGLEIKQSLYWYFISNFPKATDLSKNINKRLGVDREIGDVVGKSGSKRMCISGDFVGGEYKSSSSNTELGQKYNGYKYSLSPLKQVLETIMVFQKKTKNKSVLDDVFAYEEGDVTISPSIWAIDEGRVPTDVELGREQKDGPLSPKNGFNNNSMGNKFQKGSEKGRFPSQLFVSEDMADILDERSGILKSGVQKSSYRRVNGTPPNGTYGKINSFNMNDVPANSGGSSRILHKIKYLDEELDIAMYSTKVSNKERSYGLDDFEDVSVGANNHKNPMGMKNTQINTSSGKVRNVTTTTKNNHPTLKPIKLIYKIAQLLKTPNPQNVFFPFAGSGSEIIGFMKAGFNENLFECSELSEEYLDIAHQRIKHWRDVDMDKFLDKNKIEKLKDE